MIIKNIPLKVISIEKREGVSKKSGEPYLFYAGIFLDEASLPIRLNVNPGNFTDEAKLLKAKDLKATIYLKQRDNGLISAHIKELDC